MRQEREVLLVGLACGAVAGLLEIAVGIYLVVGRLEVVRVNPWFPLLTVIGNVVLFGLVALALSRLPYRAATGSLVGLLVFSLLLIEPFPIHLAAVALLAVGAGVRAAGLRISPRAALGTVLLISLAGAQLGYLVSRREAVQRGVAQGTMSLVLLVLDTVRAKSLSLYGYGRETTPTLDSIGRRALVFDRAIAPSPWTLPSHASMFTGLYPEDLPVGYSSGLDDEDPTLAEVLAARGYATAGFVANRSYAGRWTGIDRGFMEFHDYAFTLPDLLMSASLVRAFAGSDFLRNTIGPRRLISRKEAGVVVDGFVDWVDRTEGPFFAFLNLIDAHEPYVPPDSIVHLGPTGPLRLTSLSRLNFPEISTHPDKLRQPPEEQQKILNAYESSIWYMDGAVAALVYALARRGLRDRTLVVITSDHGESLGERQVYGHGSSLYPAETHVPLLLVGPGISPGRVPDTVSLVDLPATLLALLGFPGVLPGSDLLAGERSPAKLYLKAGVSIPGYPVSLGEEMRGLVSDSLYWIRNGDGSEETFDVRETLYAPAGTIRSSQPTDPPRASETEKEPLDRP